MWIVDHVYFGWESDVGSAISRDRFAVAQIRLRLPLDAGFLLSGNKKFGEDRTNRLTTTVGAMFGKFRPMKSGIC